MGVSSIPECSLVKDMVTNRYRHYKIGSYLLIGFAALLLVAVLFNDPQYIQNPLLMLSAASFIGGVFLFAISGGEAVDTRVANRFSLQGISSLGRIIRDLGGSGVAVFLPPDGKAGEVMQFTPTRPACRPILGDGGGFACHEGSMGTLSRPLAAPLLEDLKREDALVLPSEYGLLVGAIREVCEDLLSVAERVDIKREGDTILVSLHNYLLFAGCTSVSEDSPGYCALCPCSICSLIACMIAESLMCEVSLDHVVHIAADDTSRPCCMEIYYILKSCERIPA